MESIGNDSAKEGSWTLPEGETRWRGMSSLSTKSICFRRLAPVQDSDPAKEGSKGCGEGRTSGGVFVCTTESGSSAPTVLPYISFG